MNALLPGSFTEALGAFLLLIAIVFAFISLWACIRLHTIRLSAILVVAALAALGGHPATYFAAIFIVATAVTELEFLQTLAAIIRGDKHYFEYQKEKLTRTETQEKLAHEDAEKKAAEVTAQPVIPRAKPPARKWTLGDRAYWVEQAALTALEQEFQTSVERNVRLRRGKGTVELDGLIQGDRRQPDRIFEVLLDNGRGARATLDRAVSRIIGILDRYTEVARRPPELHIVVVCEEATPAIDISQVQKGRDLLARAFAVRLHNLRYADLGIDSLLQHDGEP